MHATRSKAKAQRRQANNKNNVAKRQNLTTATKQNKQASRETLRAPCEI